SKEDAVDVEMRAAPVDVDEDHAGGEEGGKDGCERGVGLDAGVTMKELDEGRGQRACGDRSDENEDRRDVRADSRVLSIASDRVVEEQSRGDSRQHAVAHRVAEERGASK